MDNEKVVDKIKKLLRLAESADVNEAATAAAAAQRLMEQHRIDQAVINLGEDEDQTEDETIREWGNDPLAASGRLAQWKSQLAVAIAGVNGCRCYLGRKYDGTRKTTLCLVGKESDVATVRYLFSYLTAEIERLCRRDGRGKGRTWKNSFRMGAVHTVRKRLKEAKEEARREARAKLKGKGTTAIAKLDKALARLDQTGEEVEGWMKKNMSLGSARSSHSRRDWGAYAAGKQAGASINLSGPSGSQKRGSRALGEGSE